MEVTRVSTGSQKLVYIIVGDKKVKYENGRSKIVYIGTTRNGISRISGSVAARAPDVLSMHGVKKFHVRVLTCPPRRRVKTWVKLERALLLAFRELHGEVPKCNVHGKGIKEIDEFDYYARSRIRQILEDIG